MVTSDIEERINDVFRRATKDLSKELQDIHLLGLSYEKSNHYKAIETDSKKYSALEYVGKSSLAISLDSL